MRNNLIKGTFLFDHNRYIFILTLTLFKYLLFPESGRVWAETVVFTTLILVLIGLITLFEWDVIFIDQKDYANLMPLPIRPLTVFSAKFISLIMFLGLFVVGINSLSSVVFTMYLSESKAYGFLSAFVLFLTHLLVMLAAGAFVFFTMAIIPGIFTILLRGKFFQRLSDLIRYVLVAANVFVLYFFVIDTKWIERWYESLQAIKEEASPWVMNFPPLWFTGLYQVLMGNKEIFFQKLADRALLALGAVVGVFFLVILLSYNRHLKKMAPEGVKHDRPSLLKRLAEPALNLIWLRNSTERAVFWFYQSALVRSRLHRNRVMSYLGIGVAFTLIMLVSTGKYIWKYQAGNMLSLPLVLTFFMLVGVREAANIPVSFEANWTFRITENPDRWPYFLALRKSVFLFLLLPLYGVLFALYGTIWNIKAAGLHCLYDLAFALLLMEVLFFQHKKFPFACSYLPGKSQLHVLWLVYLFLFLAYILIPRWLEPEVLAGTSRFIILYAVFILIAVALWLYHKFKFYPKHNLIYEDNPKPSIIELFHAM
ncbi:MAG: hypothetical protein J7L26_00740 [Candidatus Aminicenantes bacterium]|nr:hypothetical protein [Candidatus Aminicenantes bacterium]